MKMVKDGKSTQQHKATQGNTRQHKATSCLRVVRATMLRILPNTCDTAGNVPAGLVSDQKGDQQRENRDYKTSKYTSDRIWLYKFII